MRNQTNQNIYNKTQRFANVTKHLIISGNVLRAKRCLQLAENMFLTGNAQIKNVILNVYVFSVSSFMEIHHCSIAHLFPDSLKKEYQKQINTLQA